MKRLLAKPVLTSRMKSEQITECLPQLLEYSPWRPWATEVPAHWDPMLRRLQWSQLKLIISEDTDKIPRDKKQFDTIRLKKRLWSSKQKWENYFSRKRLSSNFLTATNTIKARKKKKRKKTESRILCPIKPAFTYKEHKQICFHASTEALFSNELPESKFWTIKMMIGINISVNKLWILFHRTKIKIESTLYNTLRQCRARLSKRAVRTERAPASLLFSSHGGGWLSV